MENRKKKLSRRSRKVEVGRGGGGVQIEESDSGWVVCVSTSAFARPRLPTHAPKRSPNRAYAVEWLMSSSSPWMGENRNGARGRGGEMAKIATNPTGLVAVSVIVFGFFFFSS